MCINILNVAEKEISECLKILAINLTRGLTVSSTSLASMDTVNLLMNIQDLDLPQTTKPATLHMFNMRPDKMNDLSCSWIYVGAENSKVGREHLGWGKTSCIRSAKIRPVRLDEMS